MVRKYAIKTNEIIDCIHRNIRRIVTAQPKLSISASKYLIAILFALLLLGIVAIYSICSLQQKAYIQEKQEQFDSFVISVISSNDSIDDYSKGTLEKNEHISSAADAFIQEGKNPLFILQDNGQIVSTFGNPVDTRKIEFYSKEILNGNKLNKSVIANFDEDYVCYYHSNSGFYIIGLVPHEAMRILKLSWQPMVLFTLLILAISVFSVWFYVKYIDGPLKRLNKLILELFSEEKDLMQNDLVDMGISEDMDFLTKKVREILVREYNIKLMLKQAELDALQSQINPHFLYNALETIRGLALSVDNIHIAKMTKALSSFFRYNISTSNSMVSVNDEIRNVYNYFIILRYRFADRYMLEVDFGEDAEFILNCTIPRLSIQPIVENAVKHGLEKKEGKGNVRITGYITETRVLITIKDDGVGMTFEQLSGINERLKGNTSGTREGKEDTEGPGTGIAITNVDKRLRLTYGELYGVSIFSTEGIGTSVEISIPL